MYVCAVSFKLLTYVRTLRGFSPTVRRWCEHGYNAAFSKTVQDLRDHFRAVVEEPEAAAETPKIQEEEKKSESDSSSERILQDAPASSTGMGIWVYVCTFFPALRKLT